MDETTIMMSDIDPILEEIRGKFLQDERDYIKPLIIESLSNWANEKFSYKNLEENTMPIA